ncbi:hypothetical protein [Cedecea sp. NFIX57]|uniref:hypothetical protein n=1 Tax=Cedecea sp. NFIX57 TaxID=1566286 RepID=UPI000A0D0DC4|nr:hypothetical protein [Cedecea sp. NFIX57]SMG52830.1 hypothetical protein SAMN03159353_101527 [Cedecea sp. NFIX57]
MKASLQQYLLCLALGIVVSPLSQAASSGIIHFRGEIVEGGCQWTPASTNIAMTCTEKGKPVTQTVALSALDGVTLHNDSTMQTRVQYLDPQRKTAVLYVTYQ